MSQVYYILSYFFQLMMLSSVLSTTVVYGDDDVEAFLSGEQLPAEERLPAVGPGKRR